MKHGQIIFIRWGEVFESEEDYYTYLEQRAYHPYEQKKSWRDWIGWALSNHFDIIEPSMPSKDNARYRAWKIWFEKIFPYLSDGEIILIGSSLGGLFLAKYLSENGFPKNISQIHLIAPVYESEWLHLERVGDFALDHTLTPSLSGISREIHIYVSSDDPICPPSHAEKYHQMIRWSHIHRFENRGHFSDQPAFPELLQNILTIYDISRF